MLKTYYSTPNKYDFSQIINFITLFGAKAFFADHSAQFASYQLIGVYNHFLKNQVRYDLANFEECLNELEKAGIPKIELANFYEHTIYFTCDESELKDIILLYKTIEDKFAKKILASIAMETLNDDSHLLEKLKDIIPIQLLKNIS